MAAWFPQVAERRPISGRRRWFSKKAPPVIGVVPLGGHLRCTVDQGGRWLFPRSLNNRKSGKYGVRHESLEEQRLEGLVVSMISSQIVKIFWHSHVYWLLISFDRKSDETSTEVPISETPRARFRYRVKKWRNRTTADQYAKLDMLARSTRKLVFSPSTPSSPSPTAHSPLSVPTFNIDLSRGPQSNDFNPSPADLSSPPCTCDHDTRVLSEISYEPGAFPLDLSSKSNYLHHNRAHVPPFIAGEPRAFPLDLTFRSNYFNPNSTDLTVPPYMSNNNPRMSPSISCDPNEFPVHLSRETHCFNPNSTDLSLPPRMSDNSNIYIPPSFANDPRAFAVHFSRETNDFNRNSANISSSPCKCNDKFHMYPAFKYSPSLNYYKLISPSKICGRCST